MMFYGMAVLCAPALEGLTVQSGSLETDVIVFCVACGMGFVWVFPCNFMSESMPLRPSENQMVDFETMFR